MLACSKRKICRRNFLVRQVIPGVQQNMLYTVTISWSAINGLTVYLENADHERFYAYAEEIDKRSWFFCFISEVIRKVAKTTCFVLHEKEKERGVANAQKRIWRIWLIPSLMWAGSHVFTDVSSFIRGRICSGYVSNFLVIGTTSCGYCLGAHHEGSI